MTRCARNLIDGRGPDRIVNGHGDHAAHPGASSRRGRRSRRRCGSRREAERTPPPGPLPEAERGRKKEDQPASPSDPPPRPGEGAGGGVLQSPGRTRAFFVPAPASGIVEYTPRSHRHDQRRSRRRPRRDRHPARTPGRERLPLERLPQRRPRPRAARGRPRRDWSPTARSARSAASATPSARRSPRSSRPAGCRTWRTCARRCRPGWSRCSASPGWGRRRPRPCTTTSASTTWPQLKAACERGEVAKLKGFGGKTQAEDPRGDRASARPSATASGFDQAFPLGLTLLAQVRDAARRHPRRAVRQPPPAARRRPRTSTSSSAAATRSRSSTPSSSSPRWCRWWPTAAPRRASSPRCGSTGTRSCSTPTSAS